MAYYGEWLVPVKKLHGQPVNYDMHVTAGSASEARSIARDKGYTVAKGRIKPLNKQRRNSSRKTRRKNAGSSSKLLKNFTGVVKRLADGTVHIIGTGLKA